MYSVSPSHFNPKGKFGKYIRSSNPDHVGINKHIEAKINQAKDAITELEDEGRLINARTIKAKMLEFKTHDFYKYVENDLKEFQKNGNIGTYKKYKAVVQSIKDFTKTEALSFEEIDTVFLNRYQADLQDNRKEQTTIHGYLSKIRSIFNKAIREGQIQINDNPFINYKIKQGTPRKDRLNIQEIEKIEELDYPENTLIWHVRNALYGTRPVSINVETDGRMVSGSGRRSLIRTNATVEINPADAASFPAFFPLPEMNHIP